MQESFVRITLLKYITGESSRKKNKELALNLPPLEEIQMKGVRIDISEATMLRFLHGAHYAPHPTGLYYNRHHLVTHEEQMEDRTSRADILRWIDILLLSRALGQLG